LLEFWRYYSYFCVMTICWVLRYDIVTTIKQPTQSNFAII